jgi:hypothetical protein
MPPKGPAPRGSVARDIEEEVEEEDVVDRPYPPHVAEFRVLPLWSAVQRAAAGLLPGLGGGVQSKAAAVPADSADGSGWRRPRLRPRVREPNLAKSWAAPAAAPATAAAAAITSAAAAAADDDDDDDDHEEPVAKRRNT